MFWVILGGLSAAAGPALAVASAGSAIQGAIKAADKAYDKAMYYSLPEEMRDLYSADEEYYVTNLEYSVVYQALMRLPKREFLVAWSDQEMGEYVRLEGEVKSGNCSDAERRALFSLLERGEKRAIYISSVMASM